MEQEVSGGQIYDYFIEGQLSLLQVLEAVCYDRENQFFCSALIAVKALLLTLGLHL
jgi:hypothetical protein